MFVAKNGVSVGFERALPLQGMFGVLPAWPVGFNVGQGRALKGPFDSHPFGAALGRRVVTGTNLLQGLAGVLNRLGQRYRGVAAQAQFGAAGANHGAQHPGAGTRVFDQQAKTRDRADGMQAWLGQTFDFQSGQGFGKLRHLSSPIDTTQRLCAWMRWSATLCIELKSKIGVDVPPKNTRKSP